jgi:hypothetical protein
MEQKPLKKKKNPGLNTYLRWGNVGSSCRTLQSIVSCVKTDENRIFQVVLYLMQMEVENLPVLSDLTQLGSWELPSCVRCNANGHREFPSCVRTDATGTWESSSWVSQCTTADMCHPFESLEYHQCRCYYTGCFHEFLFLTTGEIWQHITLPNDDVLMYNSQEFYQLSNWLEFFPNQCVRKD